MIFYHSCVPDSIEEQKNLFLELMQANMVKYILTASGLKSVRARMLPAVRPLSILLASIILK